VAELEFEVVDVFTTTAFTGNPLAVVLGAESLTTAQMQAVAGEFNLSETAFPLRPSPDEVARGVDYWRSGLWSHRGASSRHAGPATFPSRWNRTAAGSG